MAKASKDMDRQKDGPESWFAFFNEVGIINQLATAVFEKHLPEGLLISHFGVLNHLIRVKDGQTPLVLARAFQVPKTTMSHTLAGLEKRGLVEARRNQRDLRSKRIWLTDKGRAVRNQAIADLAPDLADLNAAFKVKKIEKLLPVLSGIRAFMDEARNGDPDED